MLILLSHLGYRSSNGGTFRDVELANEADFIDLIIGGHSHVTEDTVVNNIPIYQAGAYLNTLGKITIHIDSLSELSYQYETIDLNSYSLEDPEIAASIQAFEEDMSFLNEVVGYAAINHNIYGAGCLYTEALHNRTEVDFVIQNRGGIRSGIDQGEINIRDLLLVDPFNNNTIQVDISVGALKVFLQNLNGSFFFHGLNPVKNEDGSFTLFDQDWNPMSDQQQITMAINDYLFAVNEDYLPDTYSLLEKTTSEYLIEYVSSLSNDIEISWCHNYID